MNRLILVGIFSMLVFGTGGYLLYDHYDNIEMFPDTQCIYNLNANIVICIKTINHNYSEDWSFREAINDSVVRT